MVYHGIKVKKIKMNQPPHPDTLVGAPLLEKERKLNLLIFSYIEK